jgi:hypothetical protein
MNTPEQAGANLARDMIALVESHYRLNDERMMAMNGMMGAFIYIEEHIHFDKYMDDKQAGLAIHNAFARVHYPYMRERIKNAEQLDEAAKKRLLNQNAEMLQVYFPDGIVL